MTEEIRLKEGIMAEEIRVVEHYSASIANKVGEGARVLGALRDGGVNLIAFWGYKHEAGRAQLEFIPARRSALHKRRVRALSPVRSLPHPATNTLRQRSMCSGALSI